MTAFTGGIDAGRREGIGDKGRGEQHFDQREQPTPGISGLADQVFLEGRDSEGSHQAVADETRGT